MTLQDALRLQKGDVVVTRLTPVQLKPLRVKAAWANRAQTIVRVQLTGVSDRDPNAWLDATAYDLPPTGHTWCTTCHQWESKATRTLRHPKPSLDVSRTVRHA